MGGVLAAGRVRDHVADAKRIGIPTHPQFACALQDEEYLFVCVMVGGDADFPGESAAPKTRHGTARSPRAALLARLR